MAICYYIYTALIQTKMESISVTNPLQQHSHLSELLSLSLTDRRLEDELLQLGQLSCRDLQWKLWLLASLLQTWTHGWTEWKSAACTLFMMKPDSKLKVWQMRQEGQSDSSKRANDGVQNYEGEMFLHVDTRLSANTPRLKNRILPPPSGHLHGWHGKRETRQAFPTFS